MTDGYIINQKEIQIIGKTQITLDATIIDVGKAGNTLAKKQLAKDGTLR